MRHDKLQRELDLILLLAENRTYTVEQLCERLNVSRRNLYYYFDFL
ncbi:MAG: HTH domain-containing protein, partial [Prevotella sp.]|nr:HTH domain-containing protein [Prevotella sp.]